METFETMKRNIPEGATHYIDGDFYFFAWVNLSEGKYYNEGEWLNYDFSTLPDGVVKPIPAEAPEETKTYRYEKVELEEDWEYFKLMSEDGDLYVNCVDSTFEGCYGDNVNLANAIHDKVDLHRRIEVTERELFIERCEDIKKAVGDAPKVYFGMIYDELVNGKG